MTDNKSKNNNKSHMNTHFELFRLKIPFKNRLKYAKYRFKASAEKVRITTIIRLQIRARSLKNWKLQRQNNALLTALCFAMLTIVLLISRPDITHQLSNELKDAGNKLILLFPDKSSNQNAIEQSQPQTTTQNNSLTNPDQTYPQTKLGGEVEFVLKASYGVTNFSEANVNDGSLVKYISAINCPENSKVASIKLSVRYTQTSRAAVKTTANDIMFRIQNEVKDIKAVSVSTIDGYYLEMVSRTN